MDTDKVELKRRLSSKVVPFTGPAPENHRLTHSAILTLLIAGVSLLSAFAGYAYAKSDPPIVVTIGTFSEFKVTSTPEISIPVSVPVVTAVPEQTSTNTVILKTYIDTDTGLKFSYPSNMTVQSGAYTAESNNSLGSKLIEVVKDNETKLSFEYSTGAAGCANETSKVEYLFTDTVSGLNIARNKTLLGSNVNNEVYKYGNYSSKTNSEGTFCDLLFINESKSGYFFASIDATTLEQDFSAFDNIMKSTVRN